MNFRLPCLIFLIGLINSKFAFGFKCEFYEDYYGYKCKIQPDSSSILEEHLTGKTDDDITRVEFDGTLNGIEHLNESEFPYCGRFENLDYAEIRHELKSIDGNFLQHCKNLEEIQITWTEIGKFPENLLSENSKLTKLKMDFNELTTLPENIFANQKELEWLDLRFNKIISLPSNIFRQLKNLQVLILEANKIQKLNPAWFKYLKLLKIFSSDYNQISELQKNIFTPLENLVALHLSNNQLTTIHSDSFGIHRHLEIINLDNNTINAIDEKLIDNTAVDNLSMNFNNVCSQEYIEEREEMKKKLKKCFENYRPRGDADTINPEFAVGYKCELYKQPSGYTCKVQSHSSSILEKHLPGKKDKEVKIVEVNGTLTGIKHLVESEFPFCQRFKNLEKIVIENGLKSIDGNFLQKCKNLEKIRIEKTEIGEISQELFSENSKVTFLEIEDNELTTLAENIFANQTELDWLSLNSNKISFLPPNIFKPLEKLRDLFLNSNKIQTLNPAWFKNLTKLEKFSAGGNKISELPKNVFKPLENLKSLYLSNNQLTTIHSDSFGVYKKLKFIQLMSNKINAIDDKLIDNTSVSSIDMTGNVCSQGKATKRAEMKEKLKKCFKSYQPRDG